MKTLAYNNLVIARDLATLRSKSSGNLSEMAPNLNQGDRFVGNHLQLNTNPEAPRDDRWGLFSRFILIGLMTLLLSPLSLAQDFDANRMNRDITIMENILGEIFKTQIISTNENTKARAVSYAYFGNSSSRNVKGTYIPGYGVIFMVPSSPTRSYVVSGQNSNVEVAFQYSSENDDSDRSIDKESITNRIKEFLQDYASTIGQLRSEESILVIYGSANTSGNRHPVYNLREVSEEENLPKPIPVISVSAKKSALDEYRSGRISSEAFQSRLSVSETEDQQRLDLKVLGNIFSTALGDGDGNQFHLINNNSLSYMYLENFGALYSLNLHRGHGFGSFSARLFEMDRDENNNNAEEVRLSLEEREEKLAQTLKDEYDALLTKTKEFIVDYGRTLSSLKNGQYLMVSLNISDSNDIVPERIDFQISKSTFTQLDQGNISRDEALNAVTITEY